MNIQVTLFSLLVVMLSACVVPQQSHQWQLDASQSVVNFVTVKNSGIAETHVFESVAGNINERDVVVEIALASVNTGIAIRDERLRSMLFEVAKFSTLTAKAQLPESLMTLSEGESTTLTLPLQLSLHGQQKTLQATLVVNRSKTALSVLTVEPVTVTAQDFNLVVGVDSLREIAGLKHISYAVPVTFALSFTR